MKKPLKHLKTTIASFSIKLANFVVNTVFIYWAIYIVLYLYDVKKRHTFFFRLSPKCYTLPFSDLCLLFR